ADAPMSSTPPSPSSRRCPRCLMSRAPGATRSSARSTTAGTPRCSWVSSGAPTGSSAPSPSSACAPIRRTRVASTSSGTRSPGLQVARAGKRRLRSRFLVAGQGHYPIEDHVDIEHGSVGELHAFAGADRAIRPAPIVLPLVQLYLRLGLRDQEVVGQRRNSAVALPLPAAVVLLG